MFEKNYRLQDIQLSKSLAIDLHRLPDREPAQAGLPDIGGEYRARTGDLLVANQALSQLS